jgi:hypothetical protein
MAVHVSVTDVKYETNQNQKGQYFRLSYLVWSMQMINASAWAGTDVESPEYTELFKKKYKL